MTPPASTTKGRSGFLATAKCASPRISRTRRTPAVKSMLSCAPRLSCTSEPSSRVRCSHGAARAVESREGASCPEGTLRGASATHSRMVAAAAAAETQANTRHRGEEPLDRAARGASKSGSGAGVRVAGKPAMRSNSRHAQRRSRRISPWLGSAASQCDSASCSAAVRPRSSRTTQAAASRSMAR